MALRLICDREDEIERFTSREYWSVIADLKNPQGQPYQTHLTHLNGKKLDKYDLHDEAAAKAAALRIEQANLTVERIETKQVKRNPYPPFTTSTLQQDASHKCHFGASRTMQIAQKLYEGIALDGETVGLITYMRTDSTSISSQALAQARTYIEASFGQDYLPESPRIYKTKAKNAQEAHEAIRPVDLSKTPDMLSKFLDN